MHMFVAFFHCFLLFSPASFVVSLLIVLVAVAAVAAVVLVLVTATLLLGALLLFVGF